ncbi:MAG: SUMF1/EgtB/PvdO family nonheme iron enzyme, partial [Planctomycetota bacterium]
ASDDQETLVELLGNAELGQLSAIAPAIVESSDQVNGVLQDAFDRALGAWLDFRDSSELLLDETASQNERASFDARAMDLARRVGNLGAGLMLRGHTEMVKVHLELSPNPTIRSYLIQCFISAEGPADPIVTLFDDGGSSVTAAALQILGSLPKTSRVPSRVADRCVEIYQSTEDLELHASAEWFLQKNLLGRRLKGVAPSPSVGYRTVEGQFMVRLPLVATAIVGSSSLDRSRMANEKRRTIQVPSGLHFSRNELTVEQSKVFRKGTRDRQPKPVDKVRNDVATRIGFFEAARYCNWLSELEGIPEDQWCYLPNDQGEISSGMRIAEDHLERTGYQIPTPDLWEYACRGGTLTPKPYGYGNELSSEFIRWMGTREVNQQRFAIRRPNGFGLIDMLGNSAEWSTGMVDRVPGERPPFGGLFSGRGFEDRPGRPPRRPGDGGRPRIERPGERPGEVGRRPPEPAGRRPGLAFGGGPVLLDAAGAIIRANTSFAILGGAFDSPAHKVRSSDRSIISPPITNKPVTLRLMRIVAE